jgi:pyruvate dehydrogenase E1 component
MPKRPEGVTDEQIVSGIYRLREAPVLDGASPRSKRAAGAAKAAAAVPDAAPVRLVGSGAILQQVVAARELLAGRGIPAEVYSAPSFQLLRGEALAVDRWNRLHPEAEQRVPYVSQVLPSEGGQIVIATDWIRAYPDLVAPWLPASRLVLGTDGFGRSDTREALRRLFEIDPPHIAAAAVTALARAGRLTTGQATAAIRDLGVDPEAPDPRAL